MADLTLTIAGEQVALRETSPACWTGTLHGLTVTLFRPADSDVALVVHARAAGDGFALILSGKFGQHSAAHGATPEEAAEVLTLKLAEGRALYRAWEFARDVEDVGAELAEEACAHA